MSISRLLGASATAVVVASVFAGGAVASAKREHSTHRSAVATRPTNTRTWDKRTTRGRSTATLDAAKRYLADSAPVDKISARFESAALSWIGDPTMTSAKAAAEARPMIFALMSFEAKLKTQSWPTHARADVRTLIASFAGLVDDLRALSTVNLAKTSTWEPPLLRDQTTSTAATNRVRHDLGLRPLA